MSPDRAVELTPIFGSSDPHFGDPKLILLDSLLALLPKDQQVTCITAALETTYKNHDVVHLVDGLRKVMVGHKTEYCRVLRDLYNRLPKTVVVDSMWNDPEQRNYRIPIKGEAAPVLKKKILEEVISGWRMVRKWDRSFRTVYEQNEDADDCYRFVCISYKTAHSDSSLPGDILRLLKAHLESPEEPFTHTNLEPWIYHPATPNKFVPELLQAQIKLGGANRILEGLKNLESDPLQHQYHSRSL